MNNSKIKNSMLAGLLVTALLAPQGIGNASVLDRYALANSNQADMFMDLQSVSADRLQSIKQAMALGLIEGDENASFRPDDRLTRQELAALLTRALQLPIPSSLDTFADVAQEAWSSPYVAAVKQAGIMQGDDQELFRPYDYVTREEMAITLVRASQQELDGGAAPGAVKDWNGVSSWAKSFVKAAIREGIMPLSQGSFQPGEQVLRADVAQMLISAFFPEERSSLLQAMQGDSVRINGITYQLSAEVKGIFQDSNREVLKGAKLKFRAADRTIKAITELELHAIGQPAPQDKPEFSGNLRLDGHGAVVDGSVIIGGDYTTVSNLTVGGDFRITKELANDFFGSKLKIKGSTTIEGGDTNTIVFENSELQDVNVNKQEVHVVSQGGTSIESMTVQSSASITSDSSTIKQVILADGAQSVELQGTLPVVTVTSTQPVTISGNSNIDKLNVNSATEVTLNSTGTIKELAVNDASSKVTVGTDAKVTTTTGQGVSSGSVSTPSASTSSGSSGSKNTSPWLEVPLSEPNMTLGDEDIKIDLSAHFKDREQTTLKYTAISLSAKVAKASVSGSVLTVSAQGRGATTIKLVADDQNGAKVNVDLKVTVNAPPTIKQAQADMVMTYDEGNKTVALSEVFKDEDNDALTYTAESSNPSAVSVAENSGQLTLTPQSSGTSIIKVTASDGRGGTGTATFGVSVNESPTVSAIPAQFAQVGAESTELDLSSYVADKENDSWTVTLDTYDPQVADIQVSGNKLIMTAVSKGTTTVHFQVKETAIGRTGGSAAAQFQLTSTTAPVVAQQPADRVLTVDAASDSLDVSELFAGNDNETLSYEAVSSDASTLSVSETAGMVSFVPKKSGTVTVTVTATDSRAGQASLTFTVTVNEAPAIAEIPLQTVQLGVPSQEIDLSAYLTDPENDTLTLTAESKNPSLATVAVSGKKLLVTALDRGTAQVDLDVSDGRGGIAHATFSLLVNGVPTIATIADQTLQVGQGAVELDLTSLLADPDLDPLTVTASMDNTSLATVSVTGKKLSLTGVSAGLTELVVTVSDGRGGEAVRHVPVTVTAPSAPSNHAPKVEAAIYEQVLTPQITNARSYDLSQLFSDDDGDTLTFTASVLPANAAVVSVSGGSMLTLEAGSEAASGTVKVTADDGNGGSTDYTFNIKTAPLASPGLITVTAPGAGSEPPYDLSTYFPGETSFQVYLGTPDSTFVGPTPHSGSSITLTMPYMYTWVIGANGKAVVLTLKYTP